MAYRTYINGTQVFGNFSYSDIQKEIEELENTWEWTKSHRRTPDGKTVNEDTPVSLILEHHIAEDK